LDPDFARNEQEDLRFLVGGQEQMAMHPLVGYCMKAPGVEMGVQVSIEIEPLVEVERLDLVAEVEMGSTEMLVQAAPSCC
jgi:hypothetical protein